MIHDVLDDVDRALVALVASTSPGPSGGCSTWSTCSPTRCCRTSPTRSASCVAPAGPVRLLPLTRGQAGSPRVLAQASAHGDVDGADQDPVVGARAGAARRNRQGVGRVGADDAVGAHEDHVDLRRLATPAPGGPRGRRLAVACTPRVRVVELSVGTAVGRVLGRGDGRGVPGCRGEGRCGCALRSPASRTVSPAALNDSSLLSTSLSWVAVARRPLTTSFTLCDVTRAEAQVHARRQGSTQEPAPLRACRPRRGRNGSQPPAAPC